MYYTILLIYIIIVIIDIISIRKKVTKKESVIYGFFLTVFILIYILSVNDIIPREFYSLWLKSR